MPIKVNSDEEERVCIFISRPYRKMLNEVAEEQNRGQKDQMEFLIKREWKKIDPTKKLRIIQ